MTINQLKYVLALNKYKNFTIAAEKSFVSQPSLSMQIQKLEKELNIKIFDRSKKPVETTEIGEKLVKQFQIIISESLKVKDLINYQKNKIIGNLNIGISSSLESTVLPLFTDSLLLKYPDLNIQIVPVGINYDSHLNFPSSVSIYYGKPILANSYFNVENPDLKLFKPSYLA